MKFPVIVTFHEKYVEHEFFAEDEREYRGIMAHKIRERFAEGWYVEPVEPVLNFSYAEAACKTLRDNGIALTPEQESALEKVEQKHEAAKKSYEHDRMVYSMAKDVAEAGSLGEAADLTVISRGKRLSVAIYVMRYHREYEYEGYSVQEIGGMDRVTL